jgi:imidazole glycerol-phosphate synthase subunit HisH
VTTIAIIDYGAGNLLSLKRAVELGGGSPIIAHTASELDKMDGIILPGVGAAGAAMELLHAAGFDKALHEYYQAGVPLLGVCLGMQLFFDWMDEDDCAGLGLLSGRVHALTPAPTIKVPHMGWNQIEWDEAVSFPIFTGLKSSLYAYFVHSYYCDVAGDVDVAWTEHGQRFAAAVCHGTLWGTQFHPEKSGSAGLQMLANFVDIVARKVVPA